ncbi:hypothetical protein [Sphingobium indicum]|uniref:hypothetical protein n=1 Tax=Sphingobium indicum TaxID=332055 RepID=UPI0013626A33|nr:hypothetical protein [Sphingobium indicum]NYI23776.1 hypothetical protein [Sphingobium indicum]
MNLSDEGTIRPWVGRSAQGIGAPPLKSGAAIPINGMIIIMSWPGPAARTTAEGKPE